ncbi:hypothetical protein [Hyalangium minutum]|uniref:hypothetical protein n=1 Tax=Hyalangium minutum TaxID=394096 RepID=UPI0005C4D204|nr:hypothetical protein [Hyalangium minutum]
MPTRLTWVLLAALCGCSTTATVSLFDGRRFEAKIRHSDPDEVVVETQSGWVVPIPRLEISGIDHPGNVAAVAGGLVGAYGAVGLVRKLGSCDENQIPEVACVASFIPVTVGTSMLVWGLVTWFGSTRAASPQNSGAVPNPPSSSAFDFSSRDPRSIGMRTIP